MDLSPRDWFTVASTAALSVITAIPSEAWDRHGLGDWTVRELAAHTIRAWTVLVEYLDQPAPTDEPITASRYLAESLAQPGTHAGVLVRAQQDAQGMASVVETARAAAETARQRISGEPDWRLVQSRFGTLPLSEYLRTRAFELTVHGVDLARATGRPVPHDLVRASVPAIALLAEVAVLRGQAICLLLAASGRESLAADFNLLA